MKLAIITACSVGIASTYMAAEALKLAAKKRGHQPFVETQGTLGIEDEISRVVAQSVDAVIIAADVVIQKRERFTGKPIFESGVAEAVNKADRVIERVEAAFKK